MIGSVQGSGLSSAAQAVNDAITPGGGEDGVSAPITAATSSIQKAEGLAKVIGSIVTEHQPLETSGSRGTRLNLLA
ncbi:hypothetical protein [Thalassospira alkalitolerans]|uniref:Uncharacterized protein n=1 Tax=Thalassospira alkalitolerans TaxID=1293890 RepID=A0A1Y2LEZ5_9PROT|nr:hypothetical protein [Thalassospira alkalitolerans]OSQ49146.1 hypothetical protein TALK_06070 [Thalassospira alkalitolerans]|tara:strand:- start:141961 stop:142188 length:228 start_codon:yes stop_codon:yes gene_type:complete